MKLRVLLLGDYDFSLFIPLSELERAGLEIEATCETLDEIRDKYGSSHSGGYLVSDRSLKLAAEALPDKYDAIIVRDNCGTGVRKARMIDSSMQHRTMIVWNMWYPGQGQRYADMGFSHFGVRFALYGNHHRYDVLAFLKEVAAKKVLAELQRVLGDTLVAHIAGGVPGDVEDRLRKALQAFRLIEVADSTDAARAWFIGQNPILDDEAPANALAQGRSADVLAAAQSFVWLGG